MEKEEVEEKIENQKQQKRRLKAFLGRLQGKEYKELLSPLMSEIKEEDQGVQVSYRIDFDENGDIVDYSTCQAGSYQSKEWDLDLSIEADPFMAYHRLRDMADARVRAELDHIRREIKSNQEYRDALAGEVPV